MQAGKLPQCQINEHFLKAACYLPSRATEMSHRPLHLSDSLCVLLQIPMAKITRLWLNHIIVMTTDIVCYMSNFCYMSNLLRPTCIVTNMVHLQWLGFPGSWQPQVTLVTSNVFCSFGM